MKMILKNLKNQDASRFSQRTAVALNIQDIWGENKTLRWYFYIIKSKRGKEIFYNHEEAVKNIL